MVSIAYTKEAARRKHPLMNRPNEVMPKIESILGKAWQRIAVKCCQYTEGSIAMLRQIIAATAITLVTVSAHADSIDIVGSSAKPNSVSYIGYDRFDANGNPICTPCLQKSAEEVARLKAYAERRARSREYMARMQGNGVKPNSMIAAEASELTVAGEPFPAKAIPDIAQTPLRAGMN